MRPPNPYADSSINELGIDEGTALQVVQIKIILDVLYQNQMSSLIHMRDVSSMINTDKHRSLSSERAKLFL